MAHDIDRSKLPIPDPRFAGKRQRTLAGSKPDWGLAGAVQAPAGAPNVLLVLIDDAGFGNPSTFGGPIATPNLTRLAESGLKYNRFHVTALCSPTRAAMLTGRNHHAVGFGSIGELSAPFPGYCAARPQSAAPFPQVMQMNGYSTAAFGKWHLTPDHQQGPAGPFDRWPNAWGFDYFWGFLGGESGQYDPLLTENNTILGPPATKDYYLPDAMADKAIEWLHGIRAQAPDKPFFMYFSTGASHAPHQVPPGWSDKYKGKFDGGWDKYREETFERQKRLGVIPPDAKLTPRPAEMPAWDTLSAEQKRLYARQMEVYAGYQENADYNVGRVVDAINAMGERDNTLVIYIWGDNGASMEGTITGSFNELTMQNGLPLTAEQQIDLINRYGGEDVWGTAEVAPHYAAAWAWAGNCPFQWGKQVASHLGGTRDGMVVSWPGRIKDAGGLRAQFTHCIDIGPTILELAGLPQPSSVNGVAQEPMHGTSFAYTFDDAKAAERHTQQYFEIYGNRAMYKDGWWAACKLARIPWVLSPDAIGKFEPGVYDPDDDVWELYRLPDDFSQAENVAAQNPKKLKELVDLFWKEADKYNVTPLLAGFAFYFGMRPPLGKQTKFTYHGKVQNVGPGMIPSIYNRSYVIAADLEVPHDGVEGVIVAEADHLGGFSLFVDGGRLKHTYSMMGVQVYKQEASEPLPSGRVAVRLEFAADGPKMGTGGDVSLYVNDRKVGGGRIDHTVPFRFSGYSGMDIGSDNGLPVDKSYADRSPFRFTGLIHRVTFDLQPHLRAEDEESVNGARHHGLVAHGLGA
ncbi:MAG TPA: arylsulfatase [Polyangia bacterium]|nr:arylsulfatase [Polyangia bacterium]